MDLYKNKRNICKIHIDTGDKYNFIATLLILSYTIIRNSLSLVGINEKISGVAIIFFAYLLLSISLVKKRSASFIPACICTAFVIIILLFNQLLHSNYGNSFSKGFAFQRGVVIIIFFCGIIDNEYLNKCIYYSVYIGCIEIVFELLEYHLNGGYWESYSDGNIRYSTYNTELGYHAAFSVIILISTLYFEKRKNLVLMMLVAVLIIISILYGSRGCLIIYVLYLLYFLFFTKRTTKKTIYIALGISILLMICLIGFNNIVKYLIKMFEQFGFSSRTLNSYITSSEKLDSSGRDYIWAFLVDKIMDKPILGYGIFGDQFILTTEMGLHSFAHNFLLELILSFGIPIGILLFVLLVTKCVKTAKQLSGTKIGLYFIALIIFNMGNLSVSNTYWYSTRFWMMIALIIWSKYNPIHKKIGDWVNQNNNLCAIPDWDGTTTQ